ncbi:MAG: hypothetical protein LPK90_05055 [Alphaproteobacteria bacterium]|nr:hypothetical protein [Alphaproteobacteria bacterium]
MSFPKLLLMAFICCVIALPTRAEIMPVIVRHSGDDPVGKRLAVEIKNSIRSSSIFTLVYSGDDAIYDIAVVTLDPDEVSNPTRTIYSVTLLIKNLEGFDYYLTSMVGICGQQRLSVCADGIVQDLGVENEDILEALATVAVWE